MDVVSVATGASHACALTRAGALFCWGNNARGQLGLGNRGVQDLPAQVLLPEGIQGVAVFAGGNDTPIIASTGDLLCWGPTTADSSEAPLVAMSRIPSRSTARASRSYRPRSWMARSARYAEAGRSPAGATTSWGQLGRGTRDEAIHVEPAPITFE